MPKYTLDPTKLCSDGTLIKNANELKDLLIQLIENTPSCFVCSGQHTIYYKNKKTVLTLTHNLLKRPREHHDDQTRIEILNTTPFNKGGFGNIYKSQGVLVPEDSYKFKRKPPEKSRVCKIIYFDSPSQKPRIQQEAEYTRMNTLLHCKNALFTNHNGYIVMRQAYKMDLYDLIEKLIKKEIILSIDQMFQLTYNIMKAVKEQAHNLGIIHNDIKPENLIIDWELLSTTLIDYYFAQPIAWRGKREFFGTPGFIAPEIFLTMERTIRSDIFALGLTLAALWGDTSSFSCPTKEILENPQKYYQSRTWKNLFKGLYLPDDIKNKITLFFDCLTDMNPEERFLMDTAMEYWTTIHSDYKISQAKREEPVEESIGTLKKALEGFGIFKHRSGSPHNSPVPVHKPRANTPLRIISNNFGL